MPLDPAAEINNAIAAIAITSQHKLASKAARQSAACNRTWQHYRNSQPHHYQYIFFVSLQLPATQAAIARAEDISEEAHRIRLGNEFRTRGLHFEMYVQKEVKDHAP